jgi:hypothetical protein
MSPVVRSVLNKHEIFFGTRTGSVARNPNFLEDTIVFTEALNMQLALIK